MTLVVARAANGIIAIAADTLISMHGSALPMQDWMLKSICIPGGVCISFSGSPELATRDIHAFAVSHRDGPTYSEAVAHFERSSSATNNDYILAFARTGKLVTIRNGRRIQSVGRTHWIGDQSAFERFREHENRARSRHDDGRAVNVAIFGDEMDGSPASDLYSVMRNVVLDRDIASVGGFVTVISSRVQGFRFSVYSDVLFDWPSTLTANQSLALTDKIDLNASGENDRFSISQISTAYLDINIVALYVLSGRLLVIFYPTGPTGQMTCARIPGVEPRNIPAVLDQALRFPCKALCLVASARVEHQVTLPRDNPDDGVGLGLYIEANTTHTG